MTLVGIDFGTTNTVVSIFENNKAKILMDGVFKTIPTKIAKSDKFYCGNYIPIQHNNIIHSFKTTIGTDIQFNIDNMILTHTDILIIFFKHIYQLILSKSGIDNNDIKAVITVPSNFNDKMREIIKTCFNAVNINVIRIINEPSAAALAYGLNHSANTSGKILVIDTGGGTMDFTILEKTDLFFEVIHSEGLNNLGGNNFTQLIVDDMKRYELMVDETILWNQAQKFKEKLSYLDSYETKINNKNYNLSRSRFENLSNSLLKNVETVLQEIINTYPDFEYVILVGGSSRIPILQQTIKKITKKISWIHPNLETVVAEGAGLYCGIIENKFTLNDDVVLMDVLPLSLGVELVDGTYSIIIPKNTPLPVKRSQKYTTDSPSDSSIKINIYQGERQIASKNFLIGEIVFDKVTMGGVPIIEISFKVDVNSIINVTIVDKKSGLEKNIMIKTNTIDMKQIDNIIEQATISFDMDTAELARNQNIYIIRTHIENATMNLTINELISNEDKHIMLERFKTIEDTLEIMNNLMLIEVINELQNKYSLIGSNNIMESDIDSNMDSIEKILFEERKEELKNRITLLLAKNPDWKDYLDPVLEELSYNTVSSEYVDDKLKLINELETDETPRDYKKELNNLCLYLKSEIALGNIKSDELIDMINNNLKLIDTDIDCEYQINLLNKKCEEIYNL